MQKQQQPPSSDQFGAPAASDMPPFSISAGGAPQLAEAAFPISSRPPPPADGGSVGEAASNFDELDLAAGEEGGGTPGNRWPPQETLALLKIRSEKDAAFREATFKGPLWEEVSRKLAELGYKRSAKKCKEKFENVHKYYKRTKDGRAGRQDGKTYRFFSQLEALHNNGGGVATTPPAAAPVPTTSISFAAAMSGPASAASIQPLPVSAVAPSAIAMPSRVVPELGPHGISTPAAGGGGSGISFSWNSSSSSESDDEDTELEGGGSRESVRKRKHRSGEGGGSRSRRRMMSFFDGLMKQVMERQEVMQQRFLEAIEKREQDRVIREEAWRRQEMARLSREQELLAQERAMAASRDTAVISYLQKISGQSPAAAISIVPLAPEPTQSLPPQPSPKPPPLQTPPKHKPAAGPLQHDPHRALAMAAMQAVPISSEPAAEGPGGVVLESPSSSRWPKAEVHALIQLRSGLEMRYQESGPKGPLWEEISAGMKRLGYNRSSKRCKEKWENINKYFKKVKDSNKQRPEDAKTCPYFHQLEALYRRKLHGNGGAAIGAQQQRREQDSAKHSTAPPSQLRPPPSVSAEAEGNDGGVNSDAGGGISDAGAQAQAQTSNGFSDDDGSKKSEDAVKDLMSDYDKMDDEPDSELNLDHEDEDDDDDDEDDDENSKMQYKIQFQPQSVTTGGGGGGGGGGSGGANGSTATATAATTAAGSFMAMVQ